MAQTGPRFNHIVTLDSQYNQLALKLDDANNERFQQLGSLLGKKMDQLDDILRKTKQSSPIIELLKQWKDSRSGTVENLLNALDDMDQRYHTYEAILLIESWLEPQVCEMLRQKRQAKPKPTKQDSFATLNIPQNITIDINNNNVGQISPIILSQTSDNSLKIRQASRDIRVLIVYSHRAADGWALLQAGAPPLKKVTSQSCPPGDVLPFEFTGNVDLLLSKADIVVGLISRRVYRLQSFEYAINQALKLQKKVVMVHWAASCDLPPDRKVPESIRATFNNPITMSEDNTESCWQRILQKATMKPDTPSDMFLCYRDLSSGGNVANTLFDLLCLRFTILLDAAPTELEAAISNTKLFVFFLSEGVFQNEYCLQSMSEKFLHLTSPELQVALQQQKRIIVLKPANFMMPKLNELPPQWQPYKDAFLAVNVKEFDPLSIAKLAHSLEKKLNKLK